MSVDGSYLPCHTDSWKGYELMGTLFFFCILGMSECGEQKKMLLWVGRNYLFKMRISFLFSLKLIKSGSHWSSLTDFKRSSIGWNTYVDMMRIDDYKSIEIYINGEIDRYEHSWIERFSSIYRCILICIDWEVSRQIKSGWCKLKLWVAIEIGTIW